MEITFYNSVAGGDYWKRLLAEIAAAGHSVTHNYALSDFAVHDDSTSWKRLVRRWRMYPGYGLQIVIRNKTADINVACTNPFFAPALVQLLNGRQSRTVFLLYDLIPDGFELAGLIRTGGILSRLLAQPTIYALRHCSATVFLGKRLMEEAQRRYGRAAYSAIIPVGADGAPFRNYPPAPPAAGQRIRILYCGNMGQAHDGETIPKLLERGLSWPDVDWHFHSYGSRYRSFANVLLNSCKSNSCRLEGPLAGDAWFSAMRSAHIALVTARPGAEKIVMPSKTYSALVAGQAILAVCPRQSDLADLVKETDCGWVVAPGDVQGLGRVIEEVRSNPALLQAKRERAFKLGHEQYDIAIVAKKWLALFDEIAGKS